MPDNQTQPTFRFAPSPNGRLHLGHAYSALLNDQLSRRSSGRFLLRIEDIDRQRCTDVLCSDALADLRWLGLSWEEPVRRQSQHMSAYGEALAALRRLGVVYPCLCSRSMVAAAAGKTASRDPEGAVIYPGTCQHGAAREAAVAAVTNGRPHAWRLAMDRALRLGRRPLSYRAWDPETGEINEVAVDPGRWGDVVVARRDIGTSYHLAVVVDDALQNVTHVVRGLDLEAATAIHVVLQQLLGLPSPLYHHHELIADADGLKLAKSRGSRSLADLRDEGVRPDQVRHRLGFTNQHPAHVARGPS